MKITEEYYSNEDSYFKKRVAEINEKYQNGEIESIRIKEREGAMGSSIIEFKPVSEYQQNLRKKGVNL